VSDDSDHLANLSDGAGCAEVWEHLSEQRDAADADGESDPDGGSSASVDSEANSDDAVTPETGATDSTATTADAADTADAAADDGTEQDTKGASYA